MHQVFKAFLIRDWQPSDREAAFNVIRTVLSEYGLTCEPVDSDLDAFQVEAHYLETGGDFWVVEHQGRIVGTGGYYPIGRGEKSVEIRKMYLLPDVRGQGLGRHLLDTLEQTIQQRGFKEIWIETASVLKEAVILYEKSGYQPTSGVETARCDRIYVKHLRFP
ncbi:MAG TPA: GNAT family N-acetyltransferase [Trichocoleus sp.]